MIINFKSFRIYFNISETEYRDIDVRETLADLLYQNSVGIAGLELARRIYNSDQGIVLSDKEIDLIKSLYPVCKPIFIKSFNKLLEQWEKE